MSDAKRLVEIMARLREPEGGCPWDLEQSFETIAPCTIEEAYEVDDAIRRGDLQALCDELGDLLLQVVFHAQMAREAGHFDFGDVVDAISEKLVRRHPHVFGDARIETARAQTEAWEAQKAEERAARGQLHPFDDVPLSLPALLRARKLLRRAARAGLVEPDASASLARARAALRSAGGEIAGAASERRREAVGRVLLEVARLGHDLDVDPEEALRDALADFERDLRRRGGPPSQDRREAGD